MIFLKHSISRGKDKRNYFFCKKKKKKKKQNCVKVENYQNDFQKESKLDIIMYYVGTCRKHLKVEKNKDCDIVYSAFEAE